MANLNRKWRKVVAVGCTHGDLANKKIQGQVLDFVERYKPEIRFELGDLVDTAAMRAGARGTKDEARPLAPDYNAGIEWLDRYKPNRVAFGNHDWRLVELADSPNAIVAQAAGSLWEGIQKKVRELKAQTREYDFKHGWFEEGGTFWGHGYWFNENAVRDHAEYLGGPVVMAHLHRDQQVNGRTRKNSKSFCVGTLADIDAMKYARRRRQTAAWGHGLVFGEMCDTQAALWLASCQQGEDLRFPL